MDFKKKDFEGKKLVELKQILQTKLGKDTASPIAVPPVPKGWTYDIPNNFEERYSPNRQSNPINTPLTWKQKLRLNTLKEIDVISLYLSGKYSDTK